MEELGKVKGQRGVGGGEKVGGGWTGVWGRGSALELLEARLAHPHRLLGGRRQGVLGRALGAEDVAAVPAVVLGGSREQGRGGLAKREATLVRRG